MPWCITLNKGERHWKLCRNTHARAKKILNIVGNNLIFLTLRKRIVTWFSCFLFPTWIMNLHLFLFASKDKTFLFLLRVCVFRVCGVLDLVCSSISYFYLFPSLNGLHGSPSTGWKWTARKDWKAYPMRCFCLSKALDEESRGKSWITRKSKGCLVCIFYVSDWFCWTGSRNLFSSV